MQGENPPVIIVVVIARGFCVCFHFNHGSQVTVIAEKWKRKKKFRTKEVIQISNMKKKNTFASYKHQRPLSDCIDRFISFSHLRLSLIFSWGGEPTTIPTNRSNCMRFVSENAGYACSLNTLSKYASLQFSPSLQKTSSTTEMFF